MVTNCNIFQENQEFSIYEHFDARYWAPIRDKKSGELMDTHHTQNRHKGVQG